MKKIVWHVPKILIIFFLGVAVATTASSQNIWELGGEYQYNCGRYLSQHDLGIRYDNFQGKNDWNVGISYDFGHNKGKDGAKENGFALSVGYRYGFQYNPNSNLFAGVRATFEFDRWKDKDGKSLSKESVLLPAAEFGYQRIYGTIGHIYTTPAIGYGYGIKLNSVGDEKKADEGGRFIAGVSIGYRF